jgi:TetR/AcrR family tetracycline transcriptional repressor
MSTMSIGSADTDPLAGQASGPSRVRRRRSGISRHDVLAAALELIDQEGLDALSMRRLADRLDMEPMSLYKRVTSKDDLLTGIGELIWSQVAAAAPATDEWGDWLRTLGYAVRTALRDHPHAIPLLVGVEVLPTSMLEVIATQLDRTMAGWPTRDDAVSAMCTVTAFALGCAFAECSYCNPGGTDDPATAERQRLRRVARALPADAPDRLVDTALAVCGHDTDDMFAKGLDLIIRGCSPCCP